MINVLSVRLSLCAPPRVVKLILLLREVVEMLACALSVVCATVCAPGVAVKRTVPAGASGNSWSRSSPVLRAK